MNVNLYVIEVYENEPPYGPKKTNPNKPNPSGLRCLLRSCRTDQTQCFTPLVRVLYTLRGPAPLFRVIYTLRGPAPLFRVIYTLRGVFQIPSIDGQDRLVIYNGKYRLDFPAFAGKQADVIIFPENGQYSFTAFFA